MRFLFLDSVMCAVVAIIAVDVVVVVVVVMVVSAVSNGSGDGCSGDVWLVTAVAADVAVAAAFGC